MKKFIWIVFALSTVLMGCPEDVTPTLSPDLEGTWHLVFVDCDCGPACDCAPLYLDLGEYTVTFRVEAQEIMVENKVKDDFGYPLLESGTYPISVNRGERLVIEGVPYDHYFENKQLILDDAPQSTGPYVFIRFPNR